MVIEPRYLLIMACSQRKRPDPGLLPAIERYDGPSFRVLRHFLRERSSDSEKLDVFILSATYGLISVNHPVPNYDQVMTSKRAIELQQEILATFADLMHTSYTKLCLALSKKYLIAFEGWQLLVPPFTSVTITDDTQGGKLTQLRNWLWGEWPIDDIEEKQKVFKPRGMTRLRGMEIRLTSAEVLEHARTMLDEDGANARNFRDWYVEIDGQQVAPKWLVSKLAGLPVSSFTSSEARRVLNQLGLEVKRIMRIADDH